MLTGLNPMHFHSGRKAIGSRITRSSNKRGKSQTGGVLRFILFTAVGLYVFFLFLWYKRAKHPATSGKSSGGGRSAVGSKDMIEAPPSISSGSASRSSCPFRKYPPHRYFHRKERPLPFFLTQTEYIYGEFPILLSPKQQQSSQKLCVDQSAWYDSSKSTALPFADGTNPSILNLVDNPQLQLSPSLNLPEGAFYLATICMTNSQCAWKDTPQQIKDFSISTGEGPSTVRTVLLVLNQAFEVLEETTIETLIDAKFGRRIRPTNPPTKQIFALDDARLFTFQNEIWVSYREGPHYGYDKQVLNRVHLERGSSKKLQATLKASEVETLCCGRNMALLDNVKTKQLQALTWVDPITVVDVGMNNAPGAAAPRTRRRRRLLSESTQRQSTLAMMDQEDSSRFSTHRRLAQDAKKHSDFHGTNGFMVHLPSTHEYLGIGHFHRPPGRAENDYARFGHHYTHAFFTIPDEPPYYLKRLSAELLLPSQANPDDAEIIQFWSGLERVGDNSLALAYGINDCEGAATYIDMSVVESLLRDVPRGKEVVDLLAPPKNLG